MEIQQNFRATFNQKEPQCGTTKSYSRHNWNIKLKELWSVNDIVALRDDNLEILTFKGYCWI